MLGPDYNEVKQSYQERKNIVQKTIRTIAQDASSEAFRRFSSTSRKVFSCKPHTGKAYVDFVKGLEQSQKSISILSKTTPSEERRNLSLVLVLLDISGLLDSIYNTLLNILVTKVDTLGEKNENIGMVSDSKLFFYYQFWKLSRTFCKAYLKIKNPQYCLDASRKINDGIKNATLAISQLIPLISTLVSDKYIRFHFSLEDTIDAFRSLTFNEESANSLPDTALFKPVGSELSGKMSRHKIRIGSSISDIMKDFWCAVWEDSTQPKQ